MLKIDGIYEVVVPVRDLGRAEKFYTELLGLEVGLRDSRQPWVFLRAVGVLRGAGVEVHGPVVHDWMPAKSLYFADPDGHDLELCTPLAPSAR